MAREHRVCNSNVLQHFGIRVGTQQDEGAHHEAETLTTEKIYATAH